MNYLDLRLEVV